MRRAWSRKRESAAHSCAAYCAEASSAHSNATEHAPPREMSSSDRQSELKNVRRTSLQLKPKTNLRQLKKLRQRSLKLKPKLNLRQLKKLRQRSLIRTRMIILDL